MLWTCCFLRKGGGGILGRQVGKTIMGNHSYVTASSEEKPWEVVR